MIARVDQPGLALSYQDRGRVGLRRFGIAPAGAVDSEAAAQANRLLGNPPDAVVLEFALGGTSLAFEADTWLALGGGARTDGLNGGAARRVAAGETLTFQPGPDAAWSYLAIPGGWRAEEEFGSRSFHARSGLGQSIEAGTELQAADAGLASGYDHPGVARRTIHADDTLERPGTRPVRLLPGPHGDDLPVEVPKRLVETAWTISSRSDRTGYRLEGDALDPGPSIPSLPVLPGFVQITNAGLPLVTLADGPTVGGYAVPALVHPDDLPLLARHVPGTSLTFVWDEA